MKHNKVRESSFYFLRHGESLNNRMGLVNGWTDCELTELGLGQAMEAGELLAHCGIRRVHTSDLVRAKRTAEIVAEKLGIREFHVHPGLRERNWGIFEGRPKKERPALYDTPEAGESWGHFVSRVSLTLENLDLDETTLVVAHAGTFRIIRLVLGLGDEVNPLGNTIPLFIKNGELIKVSDR